MSSPWHLSNLSYLERSPPASRSLISPDTLHSPYGESLYPENNPALLPRHPKSAPACLAVCLSSLDFTLPSLPPYPFLPHYLSLWPSLSLVSPSVFVKLYSASRLSRSVFPLPAFFFSIRCLRLGIACLCLWESVKRHSDCHLRNSLQSLRDSSAFRNVFTPPVGCC